MKEDRKKLLAYIYITEVKEISVMQIKTLIEEIQGLSLDERFLVIEQTLQSIKKEELKHSTKVESEEANENHSDKTFKDIFINEKSLAVDWLSEEDSRWDNLL